MSKQPYHISKSLLTNSLLPSLPNNTPPSILKLLKFIKMQGESLIVTLSDSTYSILGILTPRCISQFERQYKRRITERTVNNLIRLKGKYEYWTTAKVHSVIGFRFDESVPILLVEEMNIVDSSDENVERLIDFVYDYVDTKFAVKEGKLRC